MIFVIYSFKLIFKTPMQNICFNLKYKSAKPIKIVSKHKTQNQKTEIFTRSQSTFTRSYYKKYHQKNNLR